MLELIAVGGKVRVGENITAVVTGINIRMHNHVAYECSWWDGNHHQCKWLESFEVVPTDEAGPLAIGFAVPLPRESKR